MPTIEKGNPATFPSSYSKFVLPFAYKPEKTTEKAKNGFYYCRVDDPECIWRERYLTHETANIMFRRSKWLSLKGKGAAYDVEMTFSNGKTRIITALPPSIVLFEWSAKMQSETDVLKTGFLIQELCFSLSNDEKPALGELLELNELFKYWQQPFEGHEDLQYKKVLKDLPWKFGEKDGIGTKFDPKELYFERWASLLEIPYVDDDGTAWRLFPTKWGEAARYHVAGGKGREQDWLMYADNRAYVWTCGIIEGGGDALEEFQLRKASASDFADWIKLLNVDPPSNSNKLTTDFEKNWADEHTYKRWEEVGTFYGFSYHSGAMLCPPSIKPPLWKHFGGMYFDFVLLLLYLRVTLFRFSRELSEISTVARDVEGGRTEWADKFRQLRWTFTLFTNLYQFPLISNQQQAVEMYALARKSMDIDDLFKEIQDEIRSSHDYISIEVAQKEAESTTRLTVVATIGFIAALVLGFWGMSEFLEEFIAWPPFYKLGTLALFSVPLVIFTVLLIIVVIFSNHLAKLFDWLSDSLAFLQIFKKKERK